jgi:hypothetical protein
MIEHFDELAARAERQTDEVAVARLEGETKGLAGGCRHVCRRVATERHVLTSPRSRRPFMSREVQRAATGAG